MTKNIVQLVLVVVALVTGWTTVELSRMRRRGSFMISGGIALTAALSVFSLWFVPPYGYGQLDESAVHAMAREVSGAVESYKATTGRCPQSLLEAGVQAPETLFGPMEYSVRVDGAQEFYELRVGDYFLNGFVYYRESRWPPEKWALDT